MSASSGNEQSPPRRMDAGLAAAPAFAVDGEVVRLLGSRCRDCAAVAVPRRSVCLSCLGPTEDARLSGRGTVHSSTVIAAPPWGFREELPYVCVDLEEGPRLLAGAVAGDEIAIGASVQAVPGTVKAGHEGFRFEAVADA